MPLSRGRQNQGSRRSASSKLAHVLSSSSPPSQMQPVQNDLTSVSRIVADSEPASATAEPPRATTHRRTRSWMSLAGHKDDLHTPDPEHGSSSGIDSRRAADTVNGAVPSDGRSSRLRSWFWSSKTRDAGDPISGADSRVIEELLDSAEEEAAGLTGATSPCDAKVLRCLPSWLHRPAG